MKTEAGRNISEYLKAGFDKYKYVLLVCVVGLLLALWPSGSGANDREPSDEIPAEGEALYDAEAMARALEAAFESIDGVGRVKVVLTVKTGYESVFAYDQNLSSSGAQQSTSSQTQLVTITGGGEQSPVVRKINYPVFLGAVIICDGGESAKVRLELTQAVKSLTGITSDNIVIAKMKN